VGNQQNAEKPQTVCVGAVAKRNILSATANTKSIERLFVPDNQIELYNKLVKG
jgi:hypothetical protein